MRPYPKVAVLLATHNGAAFVETQVRSLKANTTPFTLHWLDDHSSDDTREIVRKSARDYSIDLREWHHPLRQGYSGAFFQLLERVDDADIYLFCDQDDIWEPGKIDATVTNLLPNISSPMMCFSDPLVFNDNNPGGSLRRLTDLFGVSNAAAQQASKAFTFCMALGNTLGFTSSLRGIFLRHKEIACDYAGAHDGWMYVLAHSVCVPRMLIDAPTTLYRRHGRNITGEWPSTSRWRLTLYLSTNWRLAQKIRSQVARRAAGFVLASQTIPLGPRLDRMLTLARLVQTLDRRQSILGLTRLIRVGALPPVPGLAFLLAIACVVSNAPSPYSFASDHG